MNRSEREAARVTHEITARAIRRLDILEWVILAGAAGLAVLGGAVLAWLLYVPLGVSFRTVWIVASLVLFVVPGVISLARLRRDERKHKIENNGRNEGNDG